MASFYDEFWTWFVPRVGSFQPADQYKESRSLVANVEACPRHAVALLESFSLLSSRGIPPKQVPWRVPAWTPSGRPYSKSMAYEPTDTTRPQITKTTGGATSRRRY